MEVATWNTPMKRNLILIVLLVLLSATINIAVALGFWWFGERAPTSNEILDTGEYGMVDLRPQEIAVWRDRRETDWPDEPEWASMYNYIGITYRHIFWRKGDGSNPNVIKVDNYSIDIVELGWPMRCIAGEQWNELHMPTTPWQVTSGMFQAFGAQWPNRVLWLGMFINVLFYSALIALSFFCLRYSRRAVRKKRGHCLKCAYDLRGDYSTGCPECGYGRELA